MHYKIKVKAKKHWKPLEVEEVRRATVWAMRYLELDISPIPIKINLRGKVTSVYGDCLDLDHKIVIRLFSSTEWISTLFHELVHAKQYLYGDLQLENSYAYWKGRLLKRKNYDYSNEPWEIEAVKLEDEMTKKYLDF